MPRSGHSRLVLYSDQALSSDAFDIAQIAKDTAWLVEQPKRGVILTVS